MSTPPPTDAPPPLVVDDVHASFGTKEVLRGVTLSVAAAEVLAVFGGNGAGKSTLLKVVAGLLPAVRGAVLALGQGVLGLRPHQVARAGVGYHPQGGRVFPSLTVHENLGLIGPPCDPPLFPELDALGGRRAGLLSGGERQMLALEMLARQRPRVALLDEPSAGLAPHLIAGALRRVAGWARRTGCAVLLVEQNVAEARLVADRTVRLADGRVAGETEPALAKGGGA